MPASSMSNAPRVVVGVDGSPSSRAALRWAVNYAALNGGTVDAVMARQVPETDVIGGFGQTPAEVDDEKVIAEDAQRALDAIISEEGKADDRNRVKARVSIPTGKVPTRMTRSPVPSRREIWEGVPSSPAR